MGHLFLLPDVCEPPRPKPKAGNKRQRSSAEPAAPAAAAPSAAPSEVGSDEVRSQAESVLGDRSDGDLFEWMQPPPEGEDEPQPETQRRASAASWERAIGQDGRSHSTGASSQGSMSSFRSRRSASSTRTASKRSRTAVAWGGAPWRTRTADLDRSSVCARALVLRGACRSIYKTSAMPLLGGDPVREEQRARAAAAGGPTPMPALDEATSKLRLPPLVHGESSGGGARGRTRRAPPSTWRTARRPWWTSTSTRRRPASTRCSTSRDEHHGSARRGPCATRRRCARTAHVPRGGARPARCCRAELN